MNAQAVYDALNRLEPIMRPDRIIAFRESLEKELRNIWLDGYQNGRKDERAARENADA
jgi:hypothetical protein